MPYATPDDAPDYVPKHLRARWIAIWNHTYKTAISKGMSHADAETFAFKTANGVIKRDKKKEFLDDSDIAFIVSCLPD